MYREVIGNHIQGALKLVRFTPWLSLMGQTLVVKLLNFELLPFISFVTVSRVFLMYWEVIGNHLKGVKKAGQVYTLTSHLVAIEIHMNGV